MHSVNTIHEAAIISRDQSIDIGRSGSSVDEYRFSDKDAPNDETVHFAIYTPGRLGVTTQPRTFSTGNSQVWRTEALAEGRSGQNGPKQPAIADRLDDTIL